MRRYALAAVAGSALAISVAGTAFASHCNVPSKPAGAGTLTTVLIDPVTSAPTFLDASGNPIARPIRGFAAVYLDADRSGTLTSADFRLDPEDVFLVANHSLKANPAQGVPAALPSVDGRDPAGPGKGVDG
jgi:hypothetical protein